MRFIIIALLALVLSPAAFGVAAVTTTIDLSASTAVLGSCPGSFATTAQQDHVVLKGAGVKRSVVLQCTVAWDYVDATTSKTIHLLAGQTLKITCNPSMNTTFDTTRVGADGVVTVMIVQ